MGMSAASRTLNAALIASLLAMCLAASGPGWAARPSSLEAKVARLERDIRRLEDLQAIDALLSHYMQVFDAKDYAAYSRLFTEDGVLTCCGGTFKGQDAIYKMLTSTAPAMAAGSAHMHSDPQIVLNGDEADVVSRWMLVTKGADGRPAIAGRGRYEDVMVRGADDQWRFKSRRVFSELSGPRPAPAATGASPAR
jgi:uncharacterized protein (TIGR02246 family)